MKARTEPKIREADERSRPRHLLGELYDVATAGDQVEKVWRGLPVAKRRAIVAALIDVTILPMPPGRRKFDPETIRIAWRGQ